MAAVKPADIAASLADQYKVPPPPKTSYNGENVAVERNDDIFGDMV
jgi:hypothetical protein